MQGVEGAGCRQSAVDLLPPEREGAVGLRRLRRDALEGRIALLVSSDSVGTLMSVMILPSSLENLGGINFGNTICNLRNKFWI